MPLKILSFKFCSDNSRENKLSLFSRGNLPNSWEEFNSYLFNHNNYFHIVEKSSYIIFFLLLPICLFPGLPLPVKGTTYGAGIFLHSGFGNHSK